MNIVSELKKQERQIRFINWLAKKWKVTYEEAFKRKCKLQYQELKELIKKYEEE